MIVKSVDAMCEWVQEHVCKGLKFKQPTEMADNEAYEHILVEPQTYPMYVPTEIQGMPPTPSVCVQMLTSKSDVLNFRLTFSTWNSGTHSQDILIKNGDHYERSTKPDTFTFNEDGWRDVWNFTDKAINELRKVTLIGDMKINHESIECGMFADDDSVVNLYPYYFSWLTFSVEVTSTVGSLDVRKYL